jgi:alpha-D-ribose 1-methylphosphonate 5-triphosphate synthase subunit PhnG
LIRQNTVSTFLPDDADLQRRRREAMAVLADSAAVEIARRVNSIEPLPEHEELRPPESGLLMLRGRIGGDGAPFNFGEATVTRAAVRLASGERGFGYVLGRDPTKARLVALCDALVQSATHRNAVESNVLEPIRRQRDAARARKAQQVGATKVDFFTLVRGEG